MGNNVIKVEDFLNTEIREFSIHVIKERALPCVIDGMKPSGRKVVFTASKVAKKWMKTSALAGYCSPIGGYMRGDASLPDIIVKQTQQFPGANNYPYLEGDGAFGSRFVPNGAAAARYTKSRIGSNFEKLFIDNDILKYEEQDNEYYEPNYYLPTIPTILLNKISGIAVGFACEFHPRNPLDIIENCRLKIKNKKLKPMKPFYDGFKGTVFREEDKWVMYGKCELSNKDITVTEIPIDISREKYVEFLNKIEDRGLISSYEDHCDSEGFKFVLSVNRAQAKTFKGMSEDVLMKKLNLRKNINENLNCISEGNNLLEFDSTEQIVDYFVDFRLKTITERKIFMIKKHSDLNDILFNKIKFIQMVLDKKIQFTTKTKQELRDRIEGKKLKYIDKLIQIPVYNLTNEYKEKLEEEVDENNKIIEYYKTTSEQKLFQTDLTELRKNL